jgi:flagellum-specific ATP synthase
MTELMGEPSISSGLTRLANIAQSIAAGPLVRIGGQVTEATSSGLRVAGLAQHVRLGSLVTLEADGVSHLGEVVRLDPAGVTVKTFDNHVPSGLGMRVYREGAVVIRPDASWKSRLVDALARPIDGKGGLALGPRVMAVDADPPEALQRQRIKAPARTGVRAVDLFTPLCVGQRIGVFAGSGVGKSTLLAMLARSPDFDTIVVALVGERGREVREFVEDALTKSMARTIAVISTGDESPMMRRLAPKTAMCIAEYFCDTGDSVLLIMDSVTRYAHACREVALAAGEPPVARGFPPGIFSDLPRLLERAGPGRDGQGAITGIFSVLVDGDDHNDPVADSIRGTLDGHIVLDRAIAEQGRYPAINVLPSISRLANHVLSPEQQKLAAKLKAMIARFEETRDLRLMGGYQTGADPELDRAVVIVPKLYQALSQAPLDPVSRDPFQEIAGYLAA